MPETRIIDTFVGFDFTCCELSMITVYDSPLDFPNKYVARLWTIRDKDTPTPTPFLVIATSLEEVREKIPPHLFCFPRDPNDNGAIVETWI